MIAGQMKIDRLLDLAFFPGRTPRSREYREGCAATLEFRILGIRIESRYPAGSCAADAWAAGVEEGHSIWRASTLSAVDVASQEHELLLAWRATDERGRRDVTVRMKRVAEAHPRSQAPLLRVVR